MTPLCYLFVDYANKKRRRRMLSTLLSRGANPNPVLSSYFAGKSPLALAASCCSVKMVSILIQHGANLEVGYPLQTAYAFPVEHPNIPLKKLKITRCFAQANGMISWNSRNRNDETPLDVLCRNYEVHIKTRKIVKLLLRQGSIITTRTLLNTFKNGSERIVVYLFHLLERYRGQIKNEEGKEEKEKREEEYRAAKGYALLQAAHLGYLLAADWLVQSGVDINFRCGLNGIVQGVEVGDTPLIAAARRDSGGLAGINDYLLASGADSAILDYEGKTAADVLDHNKGGSVGTLFVNDDEEGDEVELIHV